MKLFVKEEARDSFLKGRDNFSNHCELQGAFLRTVSLWHLAVSLLGKPSSNHLHPMGTVVLPPDRRLSLAGTWDQCWDLRVNKVHEDENKRLACTIFAQISKAKYPITPPLTCCLQQGLWTQPTVLGTTRNGLWSGPQRFRPTARCSRLFSSTKILFFWSNHCEFSPRKLLCRGSLSEPLLISEGPVTADSPGVAGFTGCGISVSAVGQQLQHFVDFCVQHTHTQTTFYFCGQYGQHVFFLVPHWKAFVLRTLHCGKHFRCCRNEKVWMSSNTLQRVCGQVSALWISSTILWSQILSCVLASW